MKRTKQHKPWQVALTVAVALFLGFSLVQDSFARAAWGKYGNADLALLLNRGDAELALQLGNYFFGGSGFIFRDPSRRVYELDKARRSYALAVALDPSILWGHYQLSRIYFVEGDFKRALEEINRELEENPENLRALYVRGLVYGFRGRVGDLDLAGRDFEYFTRWAPSEWAGYNDLAWILLKQEKYAETEAAMERAFENVPSAKQNPWLWNSLGLAQLNLGAYKAARESFERALALAETLTADDWWRAYPGNDPASASGGIAQFKNALAANVSRALFQIELNGGS